MHLLLIFAAALLVAVAGAQRPSYAGSSPKGVPDVAIRFRDPNETQITLDNRVGAGSASSTTARLPVDARGDAALVDRLNRWPEEKRPFWLLNAEHIEAARNFSGVSGSGNKRNGERQDGDSRRNRNAERDDGDDWYAY